MILAETDEATDESAFLMWLATLNTVGFSAHGGKGYGVCAILGEGRR